MFDSHGADADRINVLWWLMLAISVAVFVVVLAALAYLAVLPGLGTIIMWVLAAYLLITGILSRCLIYKLADIDTTIQEQPYSSTDDRAGL